MSTGGSGGSVDVHAHVSPDAYLTRLQELAGDDPVLRGVADWYLKGFPGKLPAACTRYMFGDLVERIPALDDAGIAVQIISPGSALLFPEGASHREELVTAWNNAVHDQISRAPGRFALLSGLPLPDVDAALREIERERERVAHVGFCITSHVHGAGIEDPRWAPVFERLDELSSVVFVHPSGFRVEGLLERSLNVDLGTQFDDALTAVALSSGMTSSYPNIRWIVAHLGGAFPFLLERLDEHWERDRAHRASVHAPSESLDNIYFECAGHGDRAIAFALGVYGPERMLLGTDFPMVMADDLNALIRRSSEALGDVSTRRRIAEVNARELLELHAAGPN